MINFKLLKILSLLSISLIIFSGCSKGFFKPGNAREISPDPRERVKKNLEEGKGFRLNDAVKGATSGSRNFEFASSNELWRASLDTLDFLPLASANYRGGMIITDWYSEHQENYIKINLRFLSNEVRSDAINIKIFYKVCDESMKCKMFEKKGTLEQELKAQILKKAAIYKKHNKDKNFKPYRGNSIK